MRPINSMIEFKQIIGRGTRLYDGKDYFTIYDFVKAHQHFNDPEWDGEPAEPEETARANKFVDPNELANPSRQRKRGFGISQHGRRSRSNSPMAKTVRSST